MSKFICYGMKKSASIDTLKRITEEDLIKGKVDVFNYRLVATSKKGNFMWKMTKKPFEALKDNYSYAVGENGKKGTGYMWGKFTVLGKKKEECILIYGYELKNLENAKKILSKLVFNNDSVYPTNKKFDNFIKELDKQHIENEVVEQGKNYLIIEVEGDWKHDLLASEQIAKSCGLHLTKKEEVGDVDSDWGKTQYNYI